MAICITDEGFLGRTLHFFIVRNACVSSSAFFRLFLTSSSSREQVMRLKGLPYLRMCGDRGEVSLGHERKICDLITHWDHQTQQNMVPDLLRVKCLPCRAEKDEDSFHGGWRWVDVEHHFRRCFQISVLLWVASSGIDARHLGPSS